MILVRDVENNTCVDDWPEEWMAEAFHLTWLAIVVIPLALMVVLYSRVVYTLWLKQDNENELTHQQRVSVLIFYI